MVGSHDGYVYFLRPDGTEKAKFKTGGRVHSSPTIAKDGTVVVGSYDRYVYFLTPPQPSGVGEKVVQVECAQNPDIKVNSISRNKRFKNKRDGKSKSRGIGLGVIDK